MPWLARPRVAVALLLSINLMNYVDRQVLAAVEVKIGEEFARGGQAISDAKMGLLSTAFLLSYMLASPLFGWFADRTSRWKIVAIGVFVWSLASGASGLAEFYLALLLTRVFVGIGEAAYGPTAPTIISDLYPVERRGGRFDRLDGLWRRRDIVQGLDTGCEAGFGEDGKKAPAGEREPAQEGGIGSGHGRVLVSSRASARRAHSVRAGMSRNFTASQYNPRAAVCDDCRGRPMPRRDHTGLASFGT